MNKRDALYSREAAELLRIITTYRALRSAQLFRLFPKQEAKVQAILAHLVRQRRVYYDADTDCVAVSEQLCRTPDEGMVAAFWVLLDFIDRVEYHTAGDFPILITFFADGEVYEIVHVPLGQEALITTALPNTEDNPRRLILVDTADQISGISIPDTTGFCLAAPDGAVSYYKRKND